MLLEFVDRIRAFARPVDPNRERQKREGRERLARAHQWAKDLDLTCVRLLNDPNSISGAIGRDFIGRVGIQRLIAWNLTAAICNALEETRVRGLTAVEIRENLEEALRPEGTGGGNNAGSCVALVLPSIGKTGGRELEELMIRVALRLDDRRLARQRHEEGQQSLWQRIREGPPEETRFSVVDIGETYEYADLLLGRLAQQTYG